MARREPSDAGVRALVTTVPLMLALVSAPARAADPEAARETNCEGREAELATGQVVIIAEEPSGDRGVALKVCGVIDAAPAQVWSIVRDCESFDQFMPHVKRSQLERRDGNVAFCTTVVRLPFPVGELHSLTRVIETARTDGGFERHWTLLHGTYRRNQGSWILQPWEGDARRTLAVYRLDMDPDTLIPGALLRRVQSEAAHEVFEAVRERVRRCAGNDPPAGCVRNP
jgi:ribosome-associated toxin RatA of RatAB toxin-antitoxin module